MLPEWTRWIWNPLVAGLLLAVAATVAVAGFKRSRANRIVGSGDALATFARIGACVGASSIAGGALAIELGGAGALFWLWLTVLIGLGVASRDVSERKSPRSKPLAALSGVGIFATAVLIAAAFATSQVVAGLPSFAPAFAPWLVAIAVAGVSALLLSSRKIARLWWLVVGPLAIALFVVTGAIVCLRDPVWLGLRVADAWQEAFGLRAASSGLVSAALTHGVLWAAVAGELGLGSTRHGTAGGDARVGTRILAPLLAGLVTTTSALVVLVRPVDASPVTADAFVPLERHHSRGLRPSQQVGQTVVLPDDSGYEAGKAYAMQLRSNPRGHRVGRLLLEENAVIVPAWTVAEGIDTVVFRSREAGKQASWDVRVPVTSEHVPSRTGEGFYRLRPTDPEFTFRRFLAQYELDRTPYIPLRDADILGFVDAATSPDAAIGEHLAMYEPSYEGRPFNPAFHEFFRAGFRGPYPESDEPRPPWGYPAIAEFDAPIGSKVELRLQPDPRGVPVVRVTRGGNLEMPPWDILRGTSAVIIRHREDPNADIEVPVEAYLDEYRIRLRSLDPAWKDFRKLPAEFEGIYAVAEPVTFMAEVHGDTRLPEKFAGRRVLVPFHPLGEPQGPFGDLPYPPHPEELRQMGWSGPILVQHGTAALARDFGQDGAGAGPWVLVASLFLLGAGMLAASLANVREAAGGQFGRSFGMLAVAAILLVAALAPLIPSSAALPLAALGVLLGLLPQLLSLLVGWRS